MSSDPQDLPVIPRKGPHDTDASLLLGAADKAERGYPVGGSHVGAAVAQVLRDAVARSRTDHSAAPDTSDLREQIARAATAAHLDLVATDRTRVEIRDAGYATAGAVLAMVEPLLAARDAEIGRLTELRDEYDRQAVRSQVALDRHIESFREVYLEDKTLAEWHRHHCGAAQAAARMQDRAERVEAEVAALRATVQRVEVLADQWASWGCRSEEGHDDGDVQCLPCASMEICRALSGDAEGGA